MDMASRTLRSFWGLLLMACPESWTEWQRSRFTKSWSLSLERVMRFRARSGGITSWTENHQWSLIFSWGSTCLKSSAKTAGTEAWLLTRFWIFHCRFRVRVAVARNTLLEVHRVIARAIHHMVREVWRFQIVLRSLQKKKTWILTTNVKAVSEAVNVNGKLKSTRYPRFLSSIWNDSATQAHTRKRSLQVLVFL